MKRLPFRQLNEQKLGLAILSNVFSHKVQSKMKVEVLRSTRKCGCVWGGRE